MANPDWLSLPVEIWFCILDLIPLRDVATFCLTSSRVLSIARPPLYHNLTLVAEKQSQPNPAVLDTFALLARDADLARHVQELTLDSCSKFESYYRNPDLMHIASLRNFTQMKRVTIIGDVSRRAGRATINTFINILHDLQLDELRFPAPGVRAFILPLSAPQLAQLGNAKCMTIYGGPVDHNDLLVPRLRTIITAAQPRLTSLSLTAGSLHLHLGVLRTLHFPHLRSLAIDTTSDTQMSCPDNFNAFLSAHHETLEALDLGYTDRHSPRANLGLSSPSAILFDAATGLSPDFLPNLEVFRGHCRNVTMMAHAGMRCFSCLRALTFGCATFNPEAIKGMLDALEKVGRLGALKIVDFDLFQWDQTEREFVASFVQRFGALCGPTLDEWRGLLPFIGSWPLDVFGGFPRLRVIHFPKNVQVFNLGRVLPVPDERDEANLVREIAATCSTVEEVHFVVPLVEEQDVYWKVFRSALGLEFKCVD
ncbi:hypothetical protein DFH06DRAFT_705767 [Mycena polygramma]|nr:hypothetical protein DFH06DRAFT_705767 [Mycena polygramma]